MMQPGFLKSVISKHGGKCASWFDPFKLKVDDWCFWLFLWRESFRFLIVISDADMLSSPLKSLLFIEPFKWSCIDTVMQNIKSAMRWRGYRITLLNKSFVKSLTVHNLYRPDKERAEAQRC